MLIFSRNGVLAVTQLKPALSVGGINRKAANKLLKLALFGFSS